MNRTWSHQRLLALLPTTLKLGPGERRIFDVASVCVNAQVCCENTFYIQNTVVREHILYTEYSSKRTHSIYRIQ